MEWNFDPPSRPIHGAHQAPVYMKRFGSLNPQPLVFTGLASLLLVFLLVNACSKSGTTITPGADVFILSLDPATGTGGTVVTINGGGFSNTTTDNKVKFNGVDVVVQTATTTKLTVVAPTTGQTGVVTVQNGTSVSVNGPTFTYAAANEPIVTTYAGTGVEGFVEGPLKTAQFNKPQNIAVDLQGNMYVTEYTGGRIRKISADGVVSTLAGSAATGYKDGKGAAALLFNPGKMVCDPQGNIYFTDAGSRIRKVTPAGDVTTIAGGANCGSTDGPAASATFCGLGHIALAANGDLYVCDSNNFRVRKISNGQVTTVAGSKEGYANSTGTAALFNGGLTGITIDSKGNLFVSETYTVRKITPQGAVSTFLGKNKGFGTPTEGTGAAAIVGDFFGLTIDPADNIYVADFQSRVWKITPAAVGTIITGGNKGYKDGGRFAQFDQPSDIGRDSQGNLYVADIFNNVIRKITLR